MAADKWRVYHSYKEFLGEGYIDHDTDETYIALFLSTSNAATLTNDEFGDLTNEHAAANGYTAGGNLALNVTWTKSTATTTLDFDDPVFNASGGSIVCRFAVIYLAKTVTAPTGTFVKPLIAYSLLDNTPADVTVTDGNSLTLQINASGVLDISGGDTA